MTEAVFYHVSLGVMGVATVLNVMCMIRLERQRRRAMHFVVDLEARFQQCSSELAALERELAALEQPNVSADVARLH